jgi:hypothetical protein
MNQACSFDYACGLTSRASMAFLALSFEMCQERTASDAAWFQS